MANIGEIHAGDVVRISEDVPAHQSYIGRGKVGRVVWIQDADRANQTLSVRIVVDNREVSVIVTHEWVTLVERGAP